MIDLLDRIKAKRGKPCPIGMADRARRILAGLGLALCVSCAALPVASKVLNGALTVLDAVCEARDSHYLDMARGFLEKGDLPAAIELLKADLVHNGYDAEVAALTTLLEEQVRKHGVSGAAGASID